MNKKTREYVKTLSRNLSSVEGKPGSYETVSDGVSVVETGDVFVVSPTMSNGISVPGTKSSVVAAPGIMVGICTDGKYVYSCTSTNLYCFDINDLSTSLWSAQVPTSQTFEQVCCNGNHVLARTGECVLSYHLNGVAAGKITVDTGTTCLGVNNSYAYIGDSYGNVIKADINDSMLLVWSVSVTEIPRSITVSDKNVIVTTTGAVNNARVMDFDGNSISIVTWGTNDVIHKEYLWADGDDVVYYSDDQQLKYNHINCVSDDQTVAWSTTSVAVPGKIVCDGDVIYAVSGKGIKAIDKWSTGVLWEIPDAGYDDGTSITDICTDGYRIIAVIDDPVLDESFAYIDTGSHAKFFVKVSGTDESRYPFFNLALPVPSSRRRAMVQAICHI